MTFTPHQREIAQQAAKSRRVLIEWMTMPSTQICVFVCEPLIFAMLLHGDPHIHPSHLIHIIVFPCHMATRPATIFGMLLHDHPDLSFGRTCMD